MRKRKRKYHTHVSVATMFHSPSLPTSSCHPSEASATRPHTADLFPSSCQYHSFRRISVKASAVLAATHSYTCSHFPQAEITLLLCSSSVAHGWVTCKFLDRRSTKAPFTQPVLPYHLCERHRGVTEGQNCCASVLAVEVVTVPNPLSVKMGKPACGGTTRQGC